ncbi:MAG: signal peptidase II [Bowdeniella nasicola]|nr:signal peptidase II [Bowdeniella nasicola]
MTPHRSNRRLVSLGLTIALVCFLADQATKAWALSALEVGDYHPILGTYFGLRLVYNSGAAFSLGASVTWVFTGFALVCVIGGVYALTRLRHRSWAITVGILLGGAAGNLVDRLFREPSFGQGHVVDFLSYSSWFVGNVADIFIVGAGVLLAFLSFTSDPKDRAGVEVAPEGVAVATDSVVGSFGGETPDEQ